MRSVHNDTFGKIPSIPQQSAKISPSSDRSTSPINAKISPIIQEIPHHSQQVINAKLMPSIDLETLEYDEEEIKRLLTQAEALNPEQIRETKRWMKTAIKKVIENLLKHSLTESSKKDENDFHVANFHLIGEVDFDGDHVDLLEPLLLEEAFFRDVAALEIGVVAANVMSRATITIAIGMLLNKVNEVIKIKENALLEADDMTKEKLQSEVLILKKWLNEQTVLFNSQWKKNLLLSTLSTPKAASGIVRLVGSSGAIAGEVVGFVGLGTSLIRSAIQIHECNVNLKEHEVWVKAFHNEGQKAQSMLDKQQAIFNSRLEANAPALNELLRIVIRELEGATDRSPDLTNIYQTLKEAGINAFMKDGVSIPIESLSIKELHDQLVDPQQRPALNQMMVQKKEALSVSIRNSLKTFSRKKEEIDRGFLRLALHKAKGIFAGTTVISSLTIVLKVLIVIGIPTAGIVLAPMGYGMLLILLVFLIVGGVYLYVKKPNIFETYIKGIQTHLFLRKIPLSIQNFRSHYTQLQASKISEEVQGLGIRILAVDRLLEKKDKEEMKLYLKGHVSKRISEHADVTKILTNYREVLEAKQEKKVARYKVLSEKLHVLHHSVSKMEIKVKELQDYIGKAGWKDFQKHLTGKGKLMDREGNPLDYAEVLTDFLLQDPTLLEDSETVKLLEYMEIDMKAIRALPREVIKNESLRAIRGFFAMEEDATIEMIKKQKM